ncbi:hypothetical protein UFOVP199_2 [uncultured Caudovirales phage]|uniref:Uncharacterized protein n=1 Tax=uncultured Caudovirales phage TaxID=2100421 RepID=A0A6J7WKZ1_9CAUD|nr:hypothetical protein UFOVP199_2 [uncultured Caudovirales phage]
MSIWDNPDMKVNSDFIKFENPGDTVTGTVVSIRAHQFDDGKVVPQIILNTADGERTVTAGQVQLKALLADKRPEVGDTLTITHTEIEKRSGGKTLKHFTVAVTGKGTGVGIATTAPTAAGGMTPEQIEAMRLLGMDVPTT